MSRADPGSDRIVRADPSGGSRVVFCLLAMAAAGTVVYRMGSQRGEQATRYTATAAIFHRHALSEGPKVDGSYEWPRPDPATVERQLLSDESLDRALRQLSSQGRDTAGPDTSAGSAETTKRVRRNVQLSTAENQSPDGLWTTIAYTDEDAGRAVDLVNALAKSYAEEHGANVKEAIRRKCLEAEEAAQHARREFLAAKRRLDEFLEQHFLMHESLAEQVTKRPAMPPPPTVDPRGPRPKQPAAPKTSVNPQRLELIKRLEELERQRTRLLVERTPRHPEVQEVEAEITRVQKRLAALPDEAPQRQPEPPVPAEEPASSPSSSDHVSDPPAETFPLETAEEHREAARVFRVRKDAVDQAQRDYDRLDEVQRRLRQQQRSTPSIELDLADACRILQPGGKSPLHLMVTLVVAMAAATGVGLISGGLAVDPTLMTVRQVQNSLPVPVVGKVRATGPSAPADDTVRSRPASGRAKIVFGVLLLAICFGVLQTVF